MLQHKQEEEVRVATVKASPTSTINAKSWQSSSIRFLSLLCC